MQCSWECLKGGKNLLKTTVLRSVENGAAALERTCDRLLEHGELSQYGGQI